MADNAHEEDRGSHNVVSHRRCTWAYGATHTLEELAEFWKVWRLMNRL